MSRKIDNFRLTFTRRGIGTFLVEDPDLADSLRTELLQKQVTDFLQVMQQYHVSQAELFDELNRQLEHKESLENTDKDKNTTGNKESGLC